MTAAERRSVSVRMKPIGRSEKIGSPKPGPGRPKPSGKRKGISAAGRAAIAAAQKKRWAKLRREGKAKGKGGQDVAGMDRRKYNEAQLTVTATKGRFSLWTASLRHALLGSLPSTVLFLRWLQWERHVFVFLMVGPVRTRDSPRPEEDTLNALRRRGLHTAVLSSRHPAQTIPGRFGRTASVSLASSSPSRHEAPPNSRPLSSGC